MLPPKEGGRSKQARSSVSTQAQSLAATKAALDKELDAVRSDNKLLVDPELDRLNASIQACKGATALSQASVRTESRRIDELIRLKATVDDKVVQHQNAASNLQEGLQALQQQPDLLRADLARRQKEARATQVELDATSSRKSEIEREFETQSEKKDAAESQMKEEAIKLTECQSALHAQRTRVDETKKRHGDAKLQVGPQIFAMIAYDYSQPTDFFSLCFAPSAT